MRPSHRIPEFIERADDNFVIRTAERSEIREISRHLYEDMGFVRFPAHDLRASQLVDIDPADGDIEILAYRLDLIRRSQVR